MGLNGGWRVRKRNGLAGNSLSVSLSSSSQLFSLPPRLSLSVSRWIKSLSHGGLAEIIQVSQGRVEGGAEIPQYSCSKGYSKFNGPEVVERKRRSRRQAGSFRHSVALWLAPQPHSRKVPAFNPPRQLLVYLPCLRGFPTITGQNVGSVLALCGDSLNGMKSD